MRKSRLTNIESLRIGTMLMIVAHHLAIHGIMHNYWSSESDAEKLLVWNNGSIFNRIFTCILLPGGEIGVAIFFLISGYFMIERKKMGSVRKLFGVSIFYALVECLTLFLSYVFKINYEKTSGMGILESLFQSVFTPYNSWWFFGAYLGLMLISPIINKIFNSFNRRGEKIIIGAVWLLVYCSNLVFRGGAYVGIAKGVFFYLLGGYISKHISIEKIKTKRTLLFMASILFWIIDALLMYCMKDIVCLSSSTLSEPVVKMLDLLDGCIVVPLCAAMIFIFFVTTNIKSSLINRIATTTFGIYLMHDNGVSRELIWHNILRVDTVQYSSNYFILSACVSVILVFAVGMSIDFIRQKYFVPLTEKAWNKIVAKMNKYRI